MFQDLSRFIWKVEIMRKKNGRKVKRFLPALKEGEDVELNELHENQHFYKTAATIYRGILLKIESEGIEG